MGFEMGEYRAIEQIGSGGSAQVWRGQVTATGRPVAMKVFPPGELPAARREAALAVAVDHPHVPAVLDVLADEDRAVLVTELAAGGSLEQLLERRPKLSPGEVLTIMVPLAAVLAKAHERSLVHGDLSTANVLFDAAGRPLLADLGAARSAAEPGLPVRVTCSDTAPEIAHGGPPTSASDMFSLGSVALVCLTGRHAWPADDLRDVAIQSTVGQWPDPGDIPGPPGLIDAVRALLRREPARRPSAAALLVTLRGTGPAAPVALYRPPRHGIRTTATEQQPDPPAGPAPTTPAPATTAYPASDPARRRAVDSTEEAQRVLRTRAVTKARADAVRVVTPAVGAATAGRGRLIARACRRLFGTSRLREPSHKSKAESRSNPSTTSSGRPRPGPARVAGMAMAVILLCAAAAGAGLWWAGNDRAGSTAPARLTAVLPPGSAAVQAPGGPSRSSPAAAGSTATAVPTDGPATAALTPGTAGRPGPVAMPSTGGVSGRPLHTAPSPDGLVPRARTARPATAPNKSVDWMSVVTVLDRNRALALIYRDPALLDAVYAPSSRGKAADAVLISRMRTHGLRVTGADHTVVSAALLKSRATLGGSAGIRIDVGDLLPSYSVLDETGATVSRTKSRGIAHRVIELVSHGSGYLITNVLAAAPAG